MESLHVITLSPPKLVIQICSKNISYEKKSFPFLKNNVLTLLQSYKQAAGEPRRMRDCNLINSKTA